jgi:Holliday junction resolvase
MASPKYNKTKGTKFEVDIAKFLRSLGHFVERLAKAGNKDEGDLVAIIAGQTYILELKNRKKLDLPAFWEEAQVEAKNYAKARGLEQVPPSYVIVKRRNHSAKKAWVVQDLESWLNNASS